MGTKEVVNISKRFKLIRPANRDSWPWSGDPNRMLVLFLPWMNAQDKNVSKYTDVYSDLGLDVLCMSCVPMDLLWPQQSLKEGKNLVKILQTQCKAYDSILVHSMSVGAYNLNSFHMVIKEDKSSSYLLDKICGAIYDSVVVGGGKGGIVKDTLNGKPEGDSADALDLMIKGVIKSVSDSKVVGLILNFFSKIYFTLTKSQTVDFYVKAYAVVREEPFQVPTLVMASKNDAISDYKVVLHLADIWETDYSVPVRVQLWEKSAHAQHYMFHKDEYLDVHKQFLSDVFVKSKL